MKTVQCILGIAFAIMLSSCVTVGSKSAYFGYDSRGRAEYQQIEQSDLQSGYNAPLSSDALVTSGYYSSAVAPVMTPWYDRMWSGSVWNSYYDPFWGGAFRPAIVPMGFSPSIAVGLGWSSFRRPRIIAWNSPWWYDPFYDPFMYAPGWYGGFGPRFGVSLGFGNSWFSGCWNRPVFGVAVARPWYFSPVVGATYVATVPNSYRSFGPNRGIASQFDATRGLRVRSTTPGSGPQGGVPFNGSSGYPNPYVGGARSRTSITSPIQSNVPSFGNVQVRPESQKQTEGKSVFREDRSQERVRSFNNSRDNSPLFSSPRNSGRRFEGGGGFMGGGNSTPSRSSGSAGGGAHSRSNGQ